MKAIIAGKEDRTGSGTHKISIRLIAKSPAQARRLRRFEEVLSLLPDRALDVREGHSKGKKRLENLTIELEW